MVDIYHAGEHIGSAADAIWGVGSEQSQNYKRTARYRLMEPGGARKLIQEFVRAARDGKVASLKDLRREIAYLYGHRHRMHYHRWIQAKLPIGSGAMESMIKTNVRRKITTVWNDVDSDRSRRYAASKNGLPIGNHENCLSTQAILRNKGTTTLLQTQITTIGCLKATTNVDSHGLTRMPLTPLNMMR